MGELIELDLLRETCEDGRSGRVGRPAQALELGNRIVAIGLEVNVDYLAVCVEDLTGAVRYERRVHTDNRRSSPRPVLNRLAGMARAALAVIEDENLVAAGAAVALPGLVEAKTGTLLRAPNLGWVEIPVAGELASRLTGLSVRADNEANLAALAEHSYGVRTVKRAGAFLPAFLRGSVRRGERTGCRRRLCRDSYARVGSA